MDKQSEDQDKVRRLRLPSGKQIEVVVFGATGRRAAAGPEAQKTVAAPSRRLHVCRDCGSNLVHPIDWEEVAADTWRLELRCPNCEWIGGAVYDRSIVELLDEELERGMETIVCDLRSLTQANMEEQIDRFVAALADDLIIPFDF